MNTKFTEAVESFSSAKSEYSADSVKLGSYELKLSSPSLSDGESLDFVPFMQKVNPTLMFYVNKGFELGKMDINPESNLSKQDLSELLINKVYPRLINMESLDDAERLLKEMYFALPESKKLINDIRDQFDPNSGGVVFAIPPVVVAGVIVYAVGYAVGYFLS